MKAISAMRNQFGGHAFRTPPPEGGEASEDGAPAQSEAATQAGSGQPADGGGEATTGES
jgi:hypothetical protein